MKPLKLGGIFGVFVVWCFAVVGVGPIVRAQVGVRAPTEAPAGFDRQTNGHAPQPEFALAEATFAEKHSIADGVGPVYNALSCADCHENPVIGGNSQVFDVRAGHFNGTAFVDHPGGSLIHSRAINAAIQERVLDGNEVRALRASTSLLGLGFVEAIGDDTLRAIAAAQARQTFGLIHGTIVDVPITEDPGRTRVGRFGWKGQQASLLSFASDMYLNEMGITTPMNPVENTSNGKSVAAFDFVPPGHPTDPDDGDNDDLDAFALFMRSTMAPPRDTALAATPEAQAGEALFTQIGCSICHVPSITTAPPGTFLNLNVFASGGVQTYVVSAALGDKIIRPFSDFLLRDIGTGDGVAQGSPGSRNQVRTVPLWGLRTHSRFMHDGLSFTMNEAILRHGGEASLMTFIYQLLSPTQRNNILTFLRSL